MSETIKYDGHPKNFSRFLERFYPAVGALSFVYGKLNDTNPIDLTAIIYIGGGRGISNAHKFSILKPQKAQPSFFDDGGKPRNPRGRPCSVEEASAGDPSVVEGAFAWFPVPCSH
jgi:hypothetical protein